MIIYYHCTRDSALLLSFLLTCHPYIPFHFMKIYDFKDYNKNVTANYYLATLKLWKKSDQSLGTSITTREHDVLKPSAEWLNNIIK